VRYIYVCLNCAARSPEEYARCLQCGEYGTLVSRNDDDNDDAPSSIMLTTPRPRVATAIAGATAMDLATATPARALRLVEISRDASRNCTSTGLVEVDRVLGGGIFDAAPILLYAPAGGGKSTVALMIAHHIASVPDHDVVYATGEETIEDIARRADRLGATAARLCVVAETSLERILDLAGRSLPSLLVVDSIQVIRSDAATSDAGTAHQIRLCVAALARFAKDTKTPILIIGHVTKDGEMAGPETLRHLVDVVCYLDVTEGSRRYLSTSKNRHGSTSEIGVLEMTATGLVDAPPEIDADLRPRAAVPGSILCPVVFGERVALVEIEALVGPPRENKSSGDVNATGVDRARVQRILAILARHAAIDVTDRNVYVSVAGGLRVTDPAADLAIALAIAGSARDHAYAPKLYACGELALSGEIRAVARWESRAVEIARASTMGTVVCRGTLDSAVRQAMESVSAHAAHQRLMVEAVEAARAQRDSNPHAVLSSVQASETESDLELLIDEHIEDAEALLRDAEREVELMETVVTSMDVVYRGAAADALRPYADADGVVVVDDLVDALGAPRAPESGQ
jgi:DNA repair protein RadA/Sms